MNILKNSIFSRFGSDVEEDLDEGGLVGGISRLIFVLRHENFVDKSAKQPPKGD